MSPPITHPLAINTTVEGERKSCACRGARLLPYNGKILKVIKNHLGYWYYLDTGITVQGSTITSAHLTD